MARKYSMGYFADGNGAMEGVEYSADLAEIKQVLNNQNDSMLDWMDAMDERLDGDEDAIMGLLQENQFIMKEISRQLDVLTELLGEFSAKFGEE
ncbi:MAG: hypothetical protein GX658_00645 [Clostridiales bacterium]|nr:hypothetical protein [Clostridia bacterium]MBQ1706170.1 hypothetical protein [Clostridia bacterium]MBQ5580542.1 hypothetical protein [Clostridia bacterium]MEE1293187.1 hypothetical protein [Acutalibacteraceae bacterium]NLD28889.1 hypothetical protein [Clostridiales bacterium]